VFGVVFSAGDLRASYQGIANQDIDPQRIVLTASLRSEEFVQSVSVCKLPEIRFAGLNAYLFESDSNVSDAPQRSSAGSVAPSLVSALDHLVVNANDANGVLRCFASLGLELKLDQTIERWRVRQLFYRIGNVVIEVMIALDDGARPAENGYWGLAYRVPSLSRALQRMNSNNVMTSATREGRKPGTEVATLKSHNLEIATLLISHSPEEVV
jgi:hypothetical protein